MTIYRCHFDFDQAQDCKTDINKGFGIDAVKDGFWVTEKLKFMVPELLEANSLHKLKALSELPMMLAYQQKLKLRST